MKISLLWDGNVRPDAKIKIDLHIKYPASILVSRNAVQTMPYYAQNHIGQSSLKVRKVCGFANLIR